MPQPIENWDYFWTLGITAVKELETERGILASARHELFGAIFGRDSLITSLNLLSVYRHTRQPEFLAIVRKVLNTLVELQGKEINIESGEEPGKMIHEYRPEDHEHLTKHPEKPWYLYDDQVMRNYDTVDATALFLITLYRYLQLREEAGDPDTELATKALPAVKAALNWTFWYGDSNGDGFVDYQLKPERVHGGLLNQNWMDSQESTFHENGDPVIYPIAPVEAQAYTYYALRLWARYFDSHCQSNLSAALNNRAHTLKQRFNAKFIIQDQHGPYLASALDGRGQPLRSLRSSVGHCLWAALNPAEDGILDGIIDQDLAAVLVKRLLSPDMFEPEAGIRTLSRTSRCYEPNSYHNGSIWPHDTNMVAEGFDHYGYHDEAALARVALLKAVAHFNHPLELYVYDQDYADYRSPNGQTASQTQAWAAAAILSAVAPNFTSSSANPDLVRP